MFWKFRSALLRVNQFEVKTLGAIVLLLNGFPDEGGDGREALEFVLPETVTRLFVPQAAVAPREMPSLGWDEALVTT